MRNSILAAVVALSTTVTTQAQEVPPIWAASPPFVTPFGARGCDLSGVAEGHKGDDDVVLVTFRSLGERLDLIVERHSPRWSWHEGLSALPVRLDDQPYWVFDAFATKDMMSAALVYNGPWHWMFKDLAKSHRLTLQAGHDYTISLDGFSGAYDQWVACVTRNKSPQETEMPQ